MNQLDIAVDTMLFFQTKKQQRKIIPVNTKPVVVHFNPIYEQFDNHQRVHNQIVQDANCVRIRVKTWPEFINAVREEQPDFLTIHQSVIDLEHHTLEEFSVTVQSLVKYLPKNPQHNEMLPVAIGIDKTTTQQFVRQLKKLGFAGIWPTATAFGAEIFVTAMKQFMSNEEFWPESVINQLPDPVTRPLHIYFRADAHTFVPKEIKKKTAAAMPFIERIYCETWTEIAATIENGARQMVIDYNILNHLNLSIEQILKMVDVQAKLHNTTMAVMVGIGPATPQSLVLELKKTSVLGVSPSAVHWGVDETAKAAQALINRQPYWPDDIISQLPNPPSCPLSIYFREDWKTYITPAMLDNMKHAQFDVAYCANWDELGEALTRKPHQIIFHCSMLERLGISISEIMTMITTSLKLAKLDIPVGVGIDPEVTQSTIKELRRAGVFGLCFSAKHWGLEEITRGMMALRDRVPYWPKHIIDQLPGNKPAPVAINANGIKLTVRQQEVMDLICHRGLSNKQIAKTLSLSESTVKIHVSAVMKSYGVRNRTQLALSAGTGLKA